MSEQDKQKFKQLIQDGGCPLKAVAQVLNKKIYSK
jgi:hypothetical protein